MKKKITVIGAGGTGHTVAADLTLRGYEVWLTDGPDYAPILERSRAHGAIEITGSMTGVAKPYAITTDVKAATEGAQLVICCTVSNRDEEVARLIAPYLTRGCAVLLSAGNIGSLIYRRVFNELGVEGVIVGETSGNLFSCRLVETGKVLIGNPYGAKKAAAFPAKDTLRLVEAFRDVYELIAADCILETAFNGPNLLSHISLTLANAGAIENSRDTYYIFKQGICRSTINIAQALWEEKKAVMDALGFSCGPSPANMFRKYADPELHEFDNFKDLAGPDSLTKRYITEDIPILGCLFLSVAKAVGVETPLYAGLVQMASAINQTDYYGQGRTLANLGLSDLRGSQVPRYFLQVDA